MTDITLRVTTLYTYPVKSCAPLRHDAIPLEATGPRYDRRWMIVTPDGPNRGEPLTQRECPLLARIQPSIAHDQLRLNAPNMPELCLPLRNTSGQPIDVTLWGTATMGRDEGEEAAAWLTRYLGFTAALIRMPDEYVRPVKAKWTREPAQVSFADGFPLLIISEESLQALNRRLEARGVPAFPMLRFRPNVVIAGGDPFIEDTFTRITIGDIPCDVVKPCARCVTTTVDPATGTIPYPREPLATLATFRRGSDGGVLFGQNVIHRAQGVIRVGDEIRL